jgi:hypothetical protein
MLKATTTGVSQALFYFSATAIVVSARLQCIKILAATDSMVIRFTREISFLVHLIPTILKSDTADPPLREIAMWDSPLFENLIPNHGGSICFVFDGTVAPSQNDVRKIVSLRRKDQDFDDCVVSKRLLPDCPVHFLLANLKFGA